MGLLDSLLRLRQKAVNRNLFAFLLGNSPPDMTAVERLEAFRGWIHACVNAIAEEVSTIELRL